MKLKIWFASEILERFSALGCFCGSDFFVLFSTESSTASMFLCILAWRAGGLGSSWILKWLAKIVVFSISRGKNQISLLLAPPGKNFGKIPSCPPLEKILLTPMPSTRTSVTQTFRVKTFCTVPYYLNIWTQSQILLLMARNKTETFSKTLLELQYAAYDLLEKLASTHIFFPCITKRYWRRLLFQYFMLKICMNTLKKRRKYKSNILIKCLWYLPFWDITGCGFRIVWSYYQQEWLAAEKKFRRKSKVFSFCFLLLQWHFQFKNKLLVF